MAGTLIVWDFDWSLIDENSDTWILKQLGSRMLVEDFRRQVKAKQFTHLMHEFLGRLHEEGVTQEKLVTHLGTIPFHPQMINAVKLAHAKGAEMIILSDANTIFIESVLQSYGLRHCFQEIITNPARFDEQGKLHLSWHGEYSCALCPQNLCKGTQLLQYLGNGKSYDRIIYVGDSKNDYCPSLLLKSGDHVYARANYSLHQTLLREQRHVANLYAWSSGEDVLAGFQALFADAKHASL